MTLSHTIKQILLLALILIPTLTISSEINDLNQDDKKEITIEQNQTIITENEAKKPIVFFILGGPGSGKGTQCTLLKQKYKFVHISTGDLLRKEVTKGGERARRLKAIMDKGKLVPTVEIINLVEDYMRANGWANSMFLLDGFPRNEENLIAWMENGMNSKTDTRGILMLKLDDEKMLKRCLSRKANRSDDVNETILARIALYNKYTRPIIKHIREMKGNILKVDASGDVKSVFKRCCEKIEEVLWGDLAKNDQNNFSTDL